MPLKFCSALLSIFSRDETSPNTASKCPRHPRAFLQTQVHPCTSPEWVSGAVPRSTVDTVLYDSTAA